MIVITFRGEQKTNVRSIFNRIFNDNARRKINEKL